MCRQHAMVADRARLLPVHLLREGMAGSRMSVRALRAAWGASSGVGPGAAGTAYGNRAVHGRQGTGQVVEVGGVPWLYNGALRF